VITAADYYNQGGATSRSVAAKTAAAVLFTAQSAASDTIQAGIYKCANGSCAMSRQLSALEKLSSVASYSLEELALLPTPERLTGPPQTAALLSSDTRLLQRFEGGWVVGHSDEVAGCECLMDTVQRLDELLAQLAERTQRAAAGSPLQVRSAAHRFLLTACAL